MRLSRRIGVDVWQRLPIALSSSLAPLASRNFRLFFAGRSVSMFGGTLAPVALAFAVIDLTGSPRDVGFVLAAIMTPQVTFLLVGGVWADRLPRHLVIVGSDVVSGAAQAAIAVLLFTDNASIASLVGLSAVSGTASAFFFPASSGLIPQIVDAEQLQEANALLRLARNTTTIGGAAAAGAIVAAGGPAWALSVDAATYGFAAVCLTLLRFGELPRVPRKRFFGELAEGWHEFRSRTWVWAIVAQFALVNLCATGAFLVLGPFVAARELGGAGAWGAILACQAIGTVVAGLVALRIRPARPLLAGTAVVFLAAPPLVLLAAHASAVLIAAAALASGFALELYGVLWETTLQREIPGDKLSRVSAYDYVGSFAFLPVGLVVIGPVADLVGVSTALVACAGITVAATAAVLLVADVRKLRGPAAPAS